MTGTAVHWLLVYDRTGEVLVISIAKSLAHHLGPSTEAIGNLAGHKVNTEINLTGAY